MSARRHQLFRRAVAATGAVTLGIGLMSATASGASASPGEVDLREAPRTATVDPGAASKAARTPASSSTDFSQGAINRSARIADPLPSPNDGTVVRTDVVQDLAAQRLKATVTFRGTPSGDPAVLVYFGELSGSSCVRRVGIGGAARTAEASGQFLEAGSSFAVSRSRSGSVLTLTSQALSTFRTAEYDCAYVYVTDGASTVTQAFYAESLVTRWTPRLSIAGGHPVKAAQKGKWVRVRLEVSNTGRAAAANTRVVASGAGLKISPRSRSLGTVGARSTKYGVTFKVRVAKGAKTRNLRFTATASGAKATKAYKVGVAPKPRKYKSLSGRYFWGFATTSLSDSQGWDTQTVWFLNKRWAYVGEARHGVVPKCRKTTRTCKKYSYNAKKGIARIGGQKVKVNTYGFTYRANRKDERRFYEPATFPRKGARIGASLTNRDWSGNCLLSCTSTTTNLTLDRAGRFVRSSVSIGSWPGLGSSWASFPPDQRGTYRIISKGRIELRFANRKIERHRIGLLHDALNRPSATTGLVLGTTNYYFED